MCAKLLKVGNGRLANTIFILIKPLVNQDTTNIATHYQISEKIVVYRKKEEQPFKYKKGDVLKLTHLLHIKFLHKKLFGHLVSSTSILL